MTEKTFSGLATISILTTAIMDINSKGDYTMQSSHRLYAVSKLQIVPD